MNEQQKYQKRNLLLFPLGTVGRDAVYALINSFLLTFVLFTRSLNAAQLTAITAIMVAARIFDALNDPIMGSIIEHTHSRFGKRRPYVIFGAPISAILFAIIPIVAIKVGSLPLTMLFIILFVFVMSLWRAPVVALMPDLTPSDIRSEGNAVINLMGGIGGALGLFAGTIVTALLRIHGNLLEVP